MTWWGCGSTATLPEPGGILHASYRRAAGWLAHTKAAETKRGAIELTSFVIPDATGERKRQLIRSPDDVARVFRAAITESEATTQTMQRLEDELLRSDEAHERYKALRRRCTASQGRAGGG